LADRIGTLDLAIAEMAAELDHAASTARTPINPPPKRSPSMATHETAEIRDEPNQQQQSVEPQPTPAAAASHPEAAPKASQSPLPETVAKPIPEAGAAEKLRAEFAEIAAIAAQAARLGVTIDAADAMRKGISADALRRSVLDTLAARAEATSVIAAAPSMPTAGDSPIVRRAKERAAAGRT
jgi:hypothetical protein